MKKKVIGDCKLCGSKGVVLLNGHVLPLHHFRSTGILNDPGVVKISADLDNNKVNYIPINKTRETNGWTDYMMCEHCEKTKIGTTLEFYSADILYNEETKAAHMMSRKQYFDDHYGEIFEIGNLKYTEYKNYILSMLWRCSITKHLDFSGMSLGDKYNVELADILLNNKFTPENKFPIMIWSCHEANQITLIPFTKFKALDGGGYMYIMVIGIFMFFIKISNHGDFGAFDDGFNDNSLKENGTMRIRNINKVSWYLHINTLTDGKLNKIPA